MMELIHTNSNDPRFLELIDKLDRDLNDRYGTTQTFYNNYNGLGDILSVIIVCNGETSIACGCFKEYDQETIEIKRFYVLPESRGAGIATSILIALEKSAVALGFTLVVLETGIKQPEALRLYEKNGYTRIANYGPYINQPNSVCMKKNIVISLLHERICYITGSVGESSVGWFDHFTAK